MRNRHLLFTVLSGALVLGFVAAPGLARSQDTPATPLKLVSSRVSLAGTSNIHAYTASTTAVRVLRMQGTGALGANPWTEVLTPGVLEAFEIAIPVVTLSSPRDGVDKNMHKALKATEHPDITFRLVRVEPGTAPGTVRAVGVLTIAGVARELGLNLKTQAGESTLTVTGDVRFLMTDFGVTPPTAMLGMLKTDPKVTVAFEATFTIPRT